MVHPCSEFNVHSDYHAQAFISSNRWFGIKLDFAVTLYSIIVIYVAIFTKGKNNRSLNWILNLNIYT